MSKEYDFTVEAEFKVTIADDVDWHWWTDDDGTREWRGDFYGLKTDQEIFEHWAHNALSNGVTWGNQLDGWADLRYSDIQFEVKNVGIEE